MEYLALVLLVLALMIGWLLTLFGLPGNWLMVAAAALYAYLVGPDAGFVLSWTTVLVLAGLAALGELAELLTGAYGAKRAGGSKRGAVLAIVGSLAGGVAGAFIGLPIPIIGSLIGVVLGAGVGAAAGAMLGEAWKGRNLDKSIQIGQAAFWGRLLGTAAKTAIGSAIVVVAALAAFL